MADKSALEKAATSPDPVVRHAAIRRMEIDTEVVKLDTFLGFYAEAQEPAKPQAVNGVARREAVEPKARIKVMTTDGAALVGTVKPQKEGKGPRLANAAVKILTEHGAPLQLQELFNELKAKHPDICPPKLDSLRPRLHEQREKVAMIKGRGYWPAGAAVPH
jgi:hypothetical protein